MDKLKLIFRKLFCDHEYAWTGEQVEKVYDNFWVDKFLKYECVYCQKKELIETPNTKPIKIIRLKQ